MPKPYTWYPNRNCTNTNGSSSRIPSEGPEDDICLDRGPNYNETSDLPLGLEDAIVRNPDGSYSVVGVLRGVTVDIDGSSDNWFEQQIFLKL